MKVKEKTMTGTFIYLRIEANELDFQVLDKRLKTRPTWIHKRGEKFENKRFHKTVIYEKDCWMYEMESEKDLSTEALLDCFLDVIQEDRAALCDLAEIYDIRFYISVYPTDRQQNISFSKSHIQKISSYNIPLEYTTLYLGD